MALALAPPLTSLTPPNVRPALSKTVVAHFHM